MNPQKYVKQSKESRVKAMHNSADKVEEISYDKKFTPNEMSEIKNQLVDNSIQLFDVEQELKEVKQDYADEMAPMKADVKLAIGNLKHGKRLVTEPCFKYIDKENQEVGYYNEDGELVYSRPANINEMQLKLPLGEEVPVPELDGEGYTVTAKRTS